jgi:hypothetical protein
LQSGNQVQPSFRLVLYAAIIVSCLSFVKTDFVTKIFSAKKIDFFSDLRAKPVKKKIVKVKPAPIPPAKDSMARKEGVTLIEQYRADTSTNWKRFFTKLNRVEKGDKTIVRIAWFGDSLIEGDIIVQDVRSNLQKIFGGAGVGFVPITTNVPGFRKTINFNWSANWKTFSVLDSVKQRVPYGPLGEVFMPHKMTGITDSVAIEHEASRVKYSGVKSELNGLGSLNYVSLIYSHADSGDFIFYKLNGGAEKKVDLPVTEKISRLVINQNNPVNSIEVRFVPQDTLFIYGFSFEPAKGVVIDNYSLRGSSGIHLSGIKSAVLKQSQKVLGYDLIVLQYGLNVASEKVDDYSWYERSFGKTVEYLKTNFTSIPILIMSCSDRSIKGEGGYATMSTLPSFISSQRIIAATTHTAFWDLFSAMGGDSSMIKMADAKPSLANKDYTHFKSSGGRVVANLWVKSLLFEYNWYLAHEEKRKTI